MLNDLHCAVLLQQDRRRVHQSSDTISPIVALHLIMLSASSWQRLSLVAICLLVESATGFVRNAAFHRQLPTRASSLRPSALQVMVFTPDDWEEEELLDLEKKNLSLGLADLLSKVQIASLARMAAAFSPPGQALDIKNIEHVDVLSIDGSHIQVEAVVCEHDSCVTLSVPINFPNPCGEDGLEQCIIDNLGQLDLQAADRLRELEWAAAHKNEDEWVWQQLKCNKDMELPSWWEARPEMTEECESVRQLLNQDSFRSEIKALATKGLLTVAEDEDYVVEKAVVAAVCPAGVHIRAQARRSTLFEESALMFVDLPLAFGASVEDGEALRAAVLSTVMSASAYV